MDGYDTAVHSSVNVTIPEATVRRMGHSLGAYLALPLGAVIAHYGVCFWGKAGLPHGR